MLLHRHSEPHAAAAHLVSLAVDRLRQAPTARYRRTLILPGGDTPRHFLPLLFAQALDWSALALLPGDERRVPPGHPDRNDAMIERWRRGTPAAAARLYPLLPPSAGKDELPQPADTLLPATLAILGMGADGHVASLFGPADLAPGKPFALIATRHPDGTPRVSLTIAALCASQHILLFLGGPEKQAALTRAGDGDGSAAAEILKARPDCTIILYDERTTRGPDDA